MVYIQEVHCYLSAACESSAAAAKASEAAEPRNVGGAFEMVGLVRTHYQ